MTEVKFSTLLSVIKSRSNWVILHGFDTTDLWHYSIILGHGRLVFDILYVHSTSDITPLLYSQSLIKSSNFYLLYRSFYHWNHSTTWITLPLESLYHWNHSIIEIILPLEPLYHWNHSTTEITLPLKSLHYWNHSITRTTLPLQPLNHCSHSTTSPIDIASTQTFSNTTLLIHFSGYTYPYPLHTTRGILQPGYYQTTASQPSPAPPSY